MLVGSQAAAWQNRAFNAGAGIGHRANGSNPSPNVHNHGASLVVFCEIGEPIFLLLLLVPTVVLFCFLLCKAPRRRERTGGEHASLNQHAACMCACSRLRPTVCGPPSPPQKKHPHTPPCALASVVAYPLSEHSVLFLCAQAQPGRQPTSPSPPCNAVPDSTHHIQ